MQQLLTRSIETVTRERQNSHKSNGHCKPSRRNHRITGHSPLVAKRQPASPTPKRPLTAADLPQRLFDIVGHAIESNRHRLAANQDADQRFHVEVTVPVKDYAGHILHHRTETHMWLTYAQVIDLMSKHSTLNVIQSPTAPPTVEAVTHGGKFGCD